MLKDTNKSFQQVWKLKWIQQHETLAKICQLQSQLLEMDIEYLLYYINLEKEYLG